MQPVNYIKVSDYVLSGATVSERIDKIDSVIDALYAQMLNWAAQDAPVEMFTLSDGQTHLKAQYFSRDGIERTINSLTYMRNRLINNYLGRTTRGVDIKNFIGRR